MMYDQGWVEISTNPVEGKIENRLPLVRLKVQLVETQSHFYSLVIRSCSTRGTEISIAPA